MSKSRREDSENTQGDIPEFNEAIESGKSGKRSNRLLSSENSEDLREEEGSEEGVDSVGSEDNEPDPWGNETEGDADEDSWFSGDMLYGRGPGDDSEEDVPNFEEDDFDDGFDDDFEIGLDEEYDEDLMAVFGASEGGSEDLSETCDPSEAARMSGLPDDLPFDEPQERRDTSSEKRN